MSFDKTEYAVTSGDGHVMRLIEPMVYTTEDNGDIVVPVGFYSDGASVPRIFWRIFPPFGQYWRAALLHDYLYYSNKFSRAKCDKYFYEAMRKCGVSRLKARTIYLSVRAGGSLTYCRYRRELKKRSM
jgi:hypothetical protein